jgi:hypothetical protein
MIIIIVIVVILLLLLFLIIIIIIIIILIIMILNIIIIIIIFMKIITYVRDKVYLDHLKLVDSYCPGFPYHVRTYKLPSVY